MANAYAEAGVDYRKIQGFKDAMVECGRQTYQFPNSRSIYIQGGLAHAHGAVWEYHGMGCPRFVTTAEGLGNKNWIAEWMYENSGTGNTYYEGIGIDTMLMAVNDALAHGGMPVVYVDEVAAGQDDWFTDQKRSAALANSFLECCRLDGVALPAGESPALKYLVRSALPVTSAPVLSGTITSIVSPRNRFITGENLRTGLSIIGVRSTGLHANGISLVIKEALKLKDVFLTKLPNGKTLGEEALIPTRSYVRLIDELLSAGIQVDCLLPGTGDGVAKLAFDKQQITYRVHTWLSDEEIPPLFRFIHKVCGVSLEDCLKTFNWGMGYYIFLHPSLVQRAIDIGTQAGYRLMEIGKTEEGKRCTIFGPANDLILPPPGE